MMISNRSPNSEHSEWACKLGNSHARGVKLKIDKSTKLLLYIKWNLKNMFHVEHLPLYMYTDVRLIFIYIV